MLGGVSRSFYREGWQPWLWWHQSLASQPITQPRLSAGLRVSWLSRVGGMTGCGCTHRIRPLLETIHWSCSEGKGGTNSHPIESWLDTIRSSRVAGDTMNLTLTSTRAQDWLTPTVQQRLDNQLGRLWELESLGNLTEGGRISVPQVCPTNHLWWEKVWSEPTLEEQSPYLTIWQLPPLQETDVRTSQEARTKSHPSQGIRCSHLQPIKEGYNRSSAESNINQHQQSSHHGIDKATSKLGWFTIPLRDLTGPRWTTACIPAWVSVSPYLIYWFDSGCTRWHLLETLKRASSWSQWQRKTEMPWDFCGSSISIKTLQS